MANDNLIQKVINDLNYEIIQLKYKNETNVTMRIDTVIEFLEGVKEDVIGARDNQKFDLHRTATNCVITILDKDNDPINDGSNKLSYGDVIKISVSANTHYENATIKVNGVSFTSGNTMVVKNDLYITGVATGVPYDLSRTATNCTITVLDSDNEPITDGEDKIKYGDTIKISVVASEGYENATLTVNDASFTSGNTMTVTGDVVIVGSASAIPVATPFAVSETLTTSNKIHFDTTKGTEFSTYIAGLTYHDGSYEMMKGSGTSTFSISVMDLTPMSLTGYIVAVTFGDSVNIVYATDAGEMQGMTWTVGFQNLDANGDMAVSAETTISSIQDTTPPTWNGVIISKK